MRRIILSGTSYAGKSGLLSGFEKAGYKVVPESETQVVQELVKKLGSEATRKWIRENYYEFKKLVGERVAEVEKTINVGKDEVVIFDRSAICYIGYCHLRNSKAPQILEELSKKLTGADVLFLDALGSFDERKTEGRIMTKEEAQNLTELIKLEYEKRGFKLIPIPEFYPDEERNVQARIKHIQKILSI